MNFSGREGQGRNDSGDGPGGSQRMANKGFGCADRDFLGPVSENFPDPFYLNGVSDSPRV